MHVLPELCFGGVCCGSWFGFTLVSQRVLTTKPSFCGCSQSDRQVAVLYSEPRSAAQPGLRLSLTWRAALSQDLKPLPLSVSVSVEPDSESNNKPWKYPRLVLLLWDVQLILLQFWLTLERSLKAEWAPTWERVCFVINPWFQMDIGQVAARMLRGAELRRGAGWYEHRITIHFNDLGFFPCLCGFLFYAGMETTLTLWRHTVISTCSLLRY